MSGTGLVVPLVPRLMTPGGSVLKMFSKLWTERLICLTSLPHFMRRAASRADCTAGRSMATRTPMMAMTTRSSTNVKARRMVVMGDSGRIQRSEIRDQKLGVGGRRGRGSVQDKVHGVAAAAFGNFDFERGLEVVFLGNSLD